MVIDFDDFGCNHILSDQCQSHDCRDRLDALHYVNGNFKVTLFAIPGEMTPELLTWCDQNRGWVELAVHGYFHRSNYECEKWTYEEMDAYIKAVPEGFVKGFKAPGWQISDDCYKWLLDNGWWVADQAYNNGRRPKELPTYLHLGEGKFEVNGTAVEAWHGHTWDCVGNGIYETYDHVADLVSKATEFKFVSEAVGA